jgi:ABC-type glycerol-3-phosphate transport system substrate-binding protein
MKRIVLLLAMAAIAALMLAATAFPAAAAAPDAGCPPGFVPEDKDLPSSSVGVPSTEINSSEVDCFKKLENFPPPLKDRFGTDEVGIDNVVRGNASP